MEQEEKLLFEEINRNSRLSNPVLVEGLKNYDEAWERTRTKTKGAYREMKNKKRNQINKAIVATVLAVTSFISANVSKNVTKASINRNNAVISETKESKNYIDERISYYERLMNHTSDEQNRIENWYGRNPATDELNVDYNYSNLARHIVESSQISESEMRCVIIAAHNIINSPYLEETLNQAFTIAKNDENISGYSKELIENGTKGFLEQLQYENWEAYQKYERENIKELKAVEDYIGGKNRWPKKNYAMS